MYSTCKTVHKCIHVVLCHSTAKNVVLAGVKSVTLHDPDPVEIKHLSSQVCPMVSVLVQLTCVSLFLVLLH